jgi:SAM-dependent methyltransferase
VKNHAYRKQSHSLLGAPYRLAFLLWRRMPQSVRSAVFTKSGLGKRMKTAGRDFLARFARRDDVYSVEYYSYVDVEASRSAPAIVASVVSAFLPKRLIDVGCGTGALLAEFNSKGVAGVGLEYSPAGLQRCHHRGLEVFPFDIENDHPQQLGKFDVATCFEVAEHLAEKNADILVDLLVGLAPRVVFTAATPGQSGGVDHINEQPHEYWIAKFEQKGYRLRAEMADQWRCEWGRKNVASFYAQNIMIFEKLKRPGNEI